MEKKKSDFRKFCETMWIMAKYDVLPWLFVASLVAGGIVGFEKFTKTQKYTNLQQKIENLQKDNSR